MPANPMRAGAVALPADVPLEDVNTVRVRQASSSSSLRCSFPRTVAELSRMSAQENARRAASGCQDGRR